MTTLICRGCRTPLPAPDGCDICRPMKHNLAVAGDHPDDQVDLGELATQALQAARDRLGYLRALAPGDKNFSPNELQNLIRTIAVMSDTARKVRKEGAAAVASMSFQERSELFRDWYDSLPTAHRSHVRALLDQVDRG